MRFIPATLCYIEKDNKILMLHRVKKKKDMHKGKWNGLGGKLEFGESPRDCAIREIKEESGLDVLEMKYIGMITFPNFDNENDWHAYLYHVTDIEGELIDSPEGDLKWIPKEEVMSLNLWAGDRLFIPWVLEEKPFMAKFIYKNKQFISHHVDFL